MHSVLVAVKESQKRAQIVAALRAARPDCAIRQTDTLEDILSLLRLTTPDVLVTTLDEQRHETLHLLDDLQLSVPQVSAVVVLGVEDFELLSHAVRAGGADYLIYPFTHAELSRLLSSIEERQRALWEASMFAGTLARVEKNARQKAAETALRALVLGQPFDSSALAAAPSRLSPFLVLVHGQGAHDLLYAYLSGAYSLFDAAVPEAGGSALLVYPGDEQGPRYLRAQLLAALSHARYGAYPPLDIGVSAPVEDVESGLTAALAQARTALSFRFYDQGGSLTFYEDLTRELVCDASIAAADEDALLRAVDARNLPAVREALHRIFTHLGWPRSRPSLVLRTLNRLSARLSAHGVDTSSIEQRLQENVRFKDLERVFSQALTGGAADERSAPIV